MKRYPNDVSLEARPSFWIFQGSSASAFIVGVILALVLFKGMTWSGFDFLSSLTVALMPVVGVTVYVWAFVKDKAPSYGADLIDQAWFGVRVALYRAGLLSRPPTVREPSAKAMPPSQWACAADQQKGAR
jgi:hypothetical protein